MKTPRLFVPLTLLGITFAWTSSVGAASISFIENPDGVVPFVVVTTDISGAITTIANGGAETQTPTGGGGLASVSLGDVTGTGVRFAAIGLTQGGFINMEGGGDGVSDIIDLFTFQSAAGAAPVGFLATFRSDGSRGIPTAGEGIQTFIPETGAPQVVFTGTVTLPGGEEPVALTVTAQSDLETVPEPATLALLGASLAAFAMRRRRPHRK